ncbi:MAG: glycoside hydrolase family 32 protein [Clostridia bacterium]|nr:glycoside hydrolase family 32 protein [Clostridia bacterium]
MTDYSERPRFHYQPKKGWISDPNGLVWFKGWYHCFYQHAPDFEIPWKQPMRWGHARTKDFIHWEELPVALTPGAPYDGGGCWSGTAVVKDGRLYLFYAAITSVSTIAVAVSDDGIRFEKYEGNPVIRTYPPEGGPDFRDPALCRVGDVFYCVVASGNPADRAARLLLYRSKTLTEWDYVGVMAEWKNCKYAECPSFMPAEDGLYLLAASVCPLEGTPYFTVMYGTFSGETFEIRQASEIDKGPDQYAGQAFRDLLGRNLMMTWIPGWKYAGYADRNLGCMSVPRELKRKDGRIVAYPAEEVHHLLKPDDPAVIRTGTGFLIERQGRPPFVYEGTVQDLQILRDAYVLEVFVNEGEEVYSVLL